tara:strand:+ start:321 stop:860 length:540 start_codon:yes stop_codon:yes gene_type:complete
MRKTASEIIRELEVRVAHLEREAGLFDIFSATKRQLRSEEKSLKKYLERESGVDSVEVRISNDNDHYRGVDIYEMVLKVSYMGEEYDLVGSRVEKVGYKKASPMIFFDQARRNRAPSSRGVPAPYIKSKVQGELQVHYKISFPRMRGYSITVYPVGHRQHNRSEKLSTLFDNIEMFRGY